MLRAPQPERAPADRQTDEWPPTIRLSDWYASWLEELAVGVPVRAAQLQFLASAQLPSDQILPTVRVDDRAPDDR